MKKWNLLLAAFSMGTTPMILEGGQSIPFQQEQTVRWSEENERSGREAIAEIRSAYEAGEYDLFLKEMDEMYQRAIAEGEIELLNAMRPGLSLELVDWEKQEKGLQKDRNEALLSFVQSRDLQEQNSPFLQKVVMAVTDPTSFAEQEALEQMTPFHQMKLGSGMTPEENLLIEIDLEYEYKAMHIGPTASVLEQRIKQCALKMDKLRVIQQMAASFPRSPLKAAIPTYAEGFDARLAQSWDMADLNALVSGRIKPSNGVEEKVASLLTFYQDQLSELTREFMKKGVDSR